LRRAPLRLFALDHLSDVLLHDGHRAQQHAGFVVAGLWDRCLQLAGGDAVGDCRRLAQWPDDAPPEHEGDAGGQ
jgi:hypothetical protein